MVAVAGLTLVPVAPAGADTTVIASVSDPRGDVRLFGGDHLTVRQKKSIDIHDLVVKRVDNRVKVAVTIRRVMRRPRFDQMFFIRMQEAPDTVGGPWTYEGGFTTKDFLGYSTYSNADFTDYETCGLRAVVRPRKRMVVATLPKRCTPTDDVRIRIWSLTGTFRSDAPVYSRDSTRIPGYYSLSGAEG